MKTNSRIGLGTAVLCALSAHDSTVVASFAPKNDSAFSSLVPSALTFNRADVDAGNTVLGANPFALLGKTVSLGLTVDEVSDTPAADTPSDDVTTPDSDGSVDSAPVAPAE